MSERDFHQTREYGYKCGAGESPYLNGMNGKVSAMRIGGNGHEDSSIETRDWA